MLLPINTLFIFPQSFFMKKIWKCFILASLPRIFSSIFFFAILCIFSYLKLYKLYELFYFIENICSLLMTSIYTFFFVVDTICIFQVKIDLFLLSSNSGWNYCNHLNKKKIESLLSHLMIVISLTFMYWFKLCFSIQLFY
jgi:hypothetical protein